MEGGAVPAIVTEQLEVPIQSRLADTASLLNASVLGGGGKEETIEKETVGVPGEGEKRVIKQEAEEERKRNNFIRICEQVSTVFKEDNEVTRFTFPEANIRDVSMNIGGQGFRFDREQNVYVKRVKYNGDVKQKVLYDSVVGMVSIPVVPVAMSSPEKQIPGSGTGGRGRGDILASNTKYGIKGHNFSTWSKLANSLTEQQGKLVR